MTTDTETMAETAVSQEELAEAFKLFDSDGDGNITCEELRALIKKVGGSMSEGEAKGLISQADKDGNNGIDFSEFTKLWSAIRGDGEEYCCVIHSPQGPEDVHERKLEEPEGVEECEEETEIRKEFKKLDTDNSGFITKDEMLAIISVCEHFNGDKMAEAQKCVAELDVDEDGRVSYPEFLLGGIVSARPPILGTLTGISTSGISSSL